MHLTAGSLGGSGRNGAYWASSSGVPSFYASNLDSNNSDVGPSDRNSRWLGFAGRVFAFSGFYTSRNILYI